MGAGGGLRILVPNSVCMARSGENDRHVRRQVDHISPKLCRRESAGCEWISFAIPNNTDHKAVAHAISPGGTREGNAGLIDLHK